jgi:hypothetical protein
VLEKASPTIAIPEPGLTAAEMLARAEAMCPVLRERRAATESAGHLLDENNDAFIEAGFYRAIQPRRFGGYEFHLRDFIRIMIAVARGCPSSGWVLALTAGHPQMLSRFAERTQAEIYGSAGEVRAPLRPVPGGQAEKCDGGYLVSGAWDYASGCDHATHFIGAAVVAGSNPPQLIYALLVDRRSPSSTIGTRSACAARARSASRPSAFSCPSTGPSPRRQLRTRSRRDGAPTTTRSIPADSIVCCFSRSAPWGSASPGARSTSMKRCSAPSVRMCRLSPRAANRSITNITWATSQASSI